MLISQFDHPFSAYEMEALLRARRKGEAADVYIIDVRDYDERTDGRVIPFSIHIPAHAITDVVELSGGAFKKKYGVSRPGKKSRMLLFCRNGRRSKEAAGYLANFHYSQVTVLGQGYEEWEKLSQAGEYADDL